MGYYYSVYEWYNPLWKADPRRYALEHMLPQFKDLVTRYKPAIIFSDGEWDMPGEDWKSPELLAWLFNESPVKNDVVINDRRGKGSRHRQGTGPRNTLRVWIRVVIRGRKVAEWASLMGITAPNR